MARILVIDDDRDMRVLLRIMLELAGHEVLLAADGRAGLERQRLANADLVITDIYMPGQDGFETICALQALERRVPIIAMSGGVATATMLATARLLGAVAVLTKPFLPDELLSTVNQALTAGVPSEH